jgi:DNA repair exonuclease SbcCD nuclease subunit
MSGWPFRFVHASDFHLELPLFGVSEVPPHLRERFLEAPYEATRRVFDAVLAEEAEFLLLSGDLLSPLDSGPRGVCFLLGQIERLAARKIPVYWATGRVDSVEGWPTSGSLPANVHLFPRGRAAEQIYSREGHPLARLIGAGCRQRNKISGHDFYLDPQDIFTIAVAHGSADAEGLAGQGVDYWALGGEHEPRSLDVTSTSACYCGSPQGRQPGEPGPHGCLLIHVDDRGAPRTSFVETDSVRWSSQRILFDESTRRTDVESRLRHRIAELRAASPHTVLLVSWTLVGSGPLLGSLRHGPLAAELLAALRSEFGHGQPACWSVELTVEPAASPPAEWHDEDTILGEFLRRVQHLQAHADEDIDLDRLLGERQHAGTIASLVRLDEAGRRRALSHATWLGAELLRGDQSNPAYAQQTSS